MSTPAASNPTVEVDHNADAAYIALSTAPVARTVEASPSIQVDLDAAGAVVGIELLSLDLRDTPKESRA